MYALHLPAALRDHAHVAAPAAAKVYVEGGNGAEVSHGYASRDWLTTIPPMNEKENFSVLNKSSGRVARVSPHAAWVGWGKGGGGGATAARVPACPLPIRLHSVVLDGPTF